ncbi:AraC family transcriptional regulator (plasmid) [Ensifer sp. D2-11]
MGLTKARSVGPIIDAVERAGGNVARVFLRADLPLRLIECPEQLVPLRTQLCLLEYAAREIGDPVLPARLSLAAGVVKLGALGQHALATDRLDTAVSNTNRLMGSLLQSCTRIQLIVHDKVAKWSYMVTDPCEVGRQKNELLALGYMTDLVRSFMGPAWTPLRAVVSGSQIEAKSETELTLRADLSLSTEAALYFPSDQLDASKPIRSVQPSSAVGCGRPIGNDLLTCIEHLILLNLLDDRPTIDRISSRLGISRRTLQRRLTERGTSFDAILKGVLERQAEIMLAIPDFPVSQIAYQLGYADPAHFTRAFIAWKGMSPRAWRLARP